MARLSALLLGLALLAALPLLARAGEAESPTLPSMEDAQQVTLRHLRLTMAGQHAGGLTMRLGTLADGSRLFEMHTHIELSRSSTGEKADKFVIDQQSLEHHDAAGNPVASLQSGEEAGVTTKTSTLWAEGHVAILVNGPGGMFRKRLEIPEDFGVEHEIFQALRAAHVEGETGYRMFQALDAPAQTFKKHELWVLGKATVEHGGRTYDAWRIRQKSDGLLAEAIVSDDYLPYEMKLMGGVLKATWADESPFEVEGGGWAIDIMIPVDRGVEKQFDLEELEIRYVIDPPPSADDDPMFEDNPWQTVTQEQDGYRLQLHTGRPPKDFEPAGCPVATDDEAIARYLAATPQSQSDHPAIRARAAELVEPATNALDAAARIVRWVWAHVEKRSGARSGATAVEVLESLEGDCTEHACLTAALARAAGIPARSVGGIVYLVDSKGKAMAGYHAWNEVWVGRWIPVDATIPEVGTSARYARMHVSEPGHEERAGSMLLALTGKTRIEVVAWKHFGRERVEANAAAPAR